MAPAATNRHSLGLLLLAFLSLVHGEPSEFISIDCGKPENYTYVDGTTGLRYVSDTEFTGSGVSYNVSSALGRANPDYAQAYDLRSFPESEGKRNCYSLRAVKGRKYMLRAFFMYGNYDGRHSPPQFDLYLGTNLWYNVHIFREEVNYYTEAFAVAEANSMSVCLVNTGYGLPFLSALEMRPLDDSIYPEVNASQSLILWSPFDFGGTTEAKLIRYPNDTYDRLWNIHNPYATARINTTSRVIVNDDYHLSSENMATAITPTDGTKLALNMSSDFSWVEHALSSPLCYIFMHFAEVQLLNASDSRIFSISLNGNEVTSGFSPKYLSMSTIRIPGPVSCSKMEFLIYATKGSTLPPLINALEVFMVMKHTGNITATEDVDAIMDIKSRYGVKKNWNGDPCAPNEYIWDGLKCSYNISKIARIISLNLSSSELAGEIPASIAKLTELQQLDLSKNNLRGGIPDILASLSKLEVLNLECSGLDGSIPQALQDRRTTGSLNLRFGENKDCNSQSLGKKSNKKKTVIAVIGSVICILVILLTVVLGLRRHRKGSSLSTQQNTRRHENDKSNKGVFSSFPSFRLECKKFTYIELIDITNNFERTLGKGGFGVVYHGVLANSLSVAVKILSQSSSQGPKEFQNEVRLLSSINHRNLVPLIGYCYEDDHLGLVYECMEAGSLDYHLRENKRRILSWRDRLRIATEAAQGLEYLHKGCKPAIVHRDVKTSNILLNEKLEAKISDLGLSKIFQNEEITHVTTMVMGTPGYLDPEYYVTNMLTEKSDVYSFGIVLLELITGQPAYVKSQERIHIAHWVQPEFEGGEIREIVDQRLQGEYDTDSAWKVIEIALACAQVTSTRRPTMSEVVQLLKECCELERSPGKSSFVDCDTSNTSVETIPVLSSTTFNSMVR